MVDLYAIRFDLCCGVLGQDLMVRVGPEAHDEARARAHARPMDLTGKPMRGFVHVGPEGCSTVSALRSWLDLALAFNATLPQK